MSELYQNKYRVKSTRLKDWDYSNAGWYFVTICVKKLVPYFGKVVKAKMKLSKIGLIVKEEILKTVKIRKNIELDEWVIMPNHVHAIIILNII